MFARPLRIATSAEPLRSSTGSQTFSRLPPDAETQPGRFATRPGPVRPEEEGMLRVTAAIVALAVPTSVAFAGVTGHQIQAPPKLNGRVTQRPATWLKRPTKPERVKTLTTRWDTITVRDDARRQNFHLVGPGVNKKTAMSFSGIAIWGARLRPGKYRYGSDRSAHTWHTFRVVRG